MNFCGFRCAITSPITVIYELCFLHLLRVPVQLIAGKFVSKMIWYVLSEALNLTNELSEKKWILKLNTSLKPNLLRPIFMHYPTKLTSQLFTINRVVVCCSGNTLASINEVNLRWGRLVLGWNEWPCPSSIPGAGHLSRYVTSHAG